MYHPHPRPGPVNNKRRFVTHETSESVSVYPVQVPRIALVLCVPPSVRPSVHLATTYEYSRTTHPQSLPLPRSGRQTHGPGGGASGTLDKQPKCGSKHRNDQLTGSHITGTGAAESASGPCGHYRKGSICGLHNKLKTSQISAINISAQLPSIITGWYPSAPTTSSCYYSLLSTRSRTAPSTICRRVGIAVIGATAAST